MSKPSGASELKFKLAVRDANAEFDLCKKKYTSLRRELDNVETKLIEAKEAQLIANDNLELFQRTNVGETSLADHRELQIEEYRAVMPEMMERIKDEKPLEPLMILDLHG